MSNRDSPLYNIIKFSETVFCKWLDILDKLIRLYFLSYLLQKMGYIIPTHGQSRILIVYLSHVYYFYLFYVILLI